MARRGLRIAGAAALLALSSSQIAAAAPGAVSAAPAPPAPFPARAQPPITVFAAASLGDALDEVNRAFSARTGITVKASFAASSVLAKQIEAGAPAEVFFSADHEWV